MILSYAQNHEDVILFRALKGIKNGFYIDVGACFPVEGSVTKLFYDLGWSGINIEPVEGSFLQLNAARVRDTNLQLAIGSTEGIVSIFPGDSAGESSMLEREGVDPFRVECRTLAHICHDHVDGPIEFLKVDVEGLELEVVKSGDWETWRPKIVLCEVSLPWSNQRRDDADELVSFMRSKGYGHAYYDGLNDYFVSKECEELVELIALQPNVVDDFVAVSGADQHGEKIERHHASAREDQIAEIERLQGLLARTGWERILSAVRCSVALAHRWVGLAYRWVGLATNLVLGGSRGFVRRMRTLMPGLSARLARISFVRRCYHAGQGWYRRSTVHAAMSPGRRGSRSGPRKTLRVPPPLTMRGVKNRGGVLADGLERWPHRSRLGG